MPRDLVASDRNLDRVPGFLVTLAILLPFIVVVEVADRVRELRARLVSRFRG